MVGVVHKIHLVRGIQHTGKDGNNIASIFFLEYMVLFHWFVEYNTLIYGFSSYHYTLYRKEKNLKTVLQKPKIREGKYFLSVKRAYVRQRKCHRNFLNLKMKQE